MLKFLASKVDQQNLKDVKLDFAKPDLVHTVGLDTLQEASIKTLNQRKSQQQAKAAPDTNDNDESSRIKLLQYSYPKSSLYGQGQGS